MDTACLRIKFTPLLQKNPKGNSKCCLEIVPEVSCIQNLDKLTWRQETNFIEYTIPMTYKVILKKRQTRQDTIDVKTYHSCVDLLHSSSKSTLNLGYGDVSKILSDTFIFGRNIDNSSSKEHIMIKSLMDDGKPSDLIRNYPVFHKTTNTTFQAIDTEPKRAIENIKNDKVKVKTNVQQNIESIILDKISLDKITNTEKVYPIFNETVKFGNAVIHTVPTKTSTIADSRRRLSLSPICSVSTQETPMINKVVASKAITCKIYDSQKDLVPLGSISTPSDLSNENQPTNVLSTITDISGQTSSKRLKCRVPPEIRVSEYVQYMEKEILPLKMILNEVICKCSALGITFSKKSSKQSLTYKTMSTYSCTPSIAKSEDIIKSNRVVYSIVFDG